MASTIESIIAPEKLTTRYRIAFALHNMSRVCSVRYRYARHRYGCRTEFAEVSGTGSDVHNFLCEIGCGVTF